MVARSDRVLIMLMSGLGWTTSAAILIAARVLLIAAACKCLRMQAIYHLH